jgi:hypothetical protein
LDSETVEGRLPASLLGLGGATTKTQSKKETTGRIAKDELSRHSPVARIFHESLAATTDMAVLLSEL